MKILCIDLDYFMSPTIQLYNNAFFDNNPLTRWNDLFNNTDFKENHLTIDQSNLLFCAGRELPDDVHHRSSESFATFVEEVIGRRGALRPLAEDGTQVDSDAKPEEAAWFNDFQKSCGPAENIARFREFIV